MIYLRTLTLVLLATAIVGHLSRRIRIPAVVGQLVVGIILGQAVLGWVPNDQFMHIFSEIGVIILMFMAGLESDLALLKKYFVPSLAVAVFGVVLPVGLVFGFGFLFNLSIESSLFLGVTFAATSVSITVEVLKEMNKLDTKEGSTILGAAVIDDILAVLILSVLVSVYGNVGSSSGETNSILLNLVLQAVYFIGVYVIFKWVAPILMSLGEKLQVPASVVLMSLVMCLGMAYLADLVGLSTVVGSFFAGIAVGQTEYRAEIDHNIIPIGYAVFIPMFFVSIGLNMTFHGFISDLKFTVPLLLLALFTKWFGCGLGARLTGMNFDSASIIGSGMVSRGEMALIVAQVGFQAHLLHADYYSGVIMVIILTTLIAPGMIKSALGRQAKNMTHQSAETTE